MLGGIGRECDAKVLREQFNTFGIIINIHIPKIQRVYWGFKNVRDVEYLLNLKHDILVGGGRYPRLGIASRLVLGCLAMWIRGRHG